MAFLNLVGRPCVIGVEKLKKIKRNSMVDLHGESFSRAVCAAIRGICNEDFYPADNSIRCKGVSREGNDIVVTLPFYGTVKGHYLIVINKESSEFLTSKVNSALANDLRYSVLCEILNTAVGEAVLPLIKEYKDIAVFSPIISACPIEYPQVDSVKTTICNASGMEIELYTMIELQSSSAIDDKIKAAVKDVYDATEIKSQYLEVLAHELKTPLNSVAGFTDLLLEGDLSTEQREMISSLKLSSEEINSTLNSILEYMSLGHDDMRVENSQFNLENLIARVSEKAQKYTGQKNIQFMTEFNGTVPHIVGDSVKLEKALNALLENAVKFTEEGEVSIELNSQVCGDGVQAVEFKVTDSGIGIPRESLTKILEPFERVDSSITREHKGIGLGLPICSRLVSILGGSLLIESTPQQGTSASFLLNLTLAPDSSAEEAYFKGKRAVILGANSDDSLKNTLSHFGLEVDYFDSLVSFLKRNKQKFDVLYQRLESEESLQAAEIFTRNRIVDKIVNVVDFADSSLKNQLLKLGAIHFLSTPFNTNEILEVSKRVLDYREKTEPVKSIKAANLKVLIAEDNIVNQLVIKKVFDLLGCEIDIASDGLEALQKLDKSKFDIVFMDLNMPNLDGLTATKKIRLKEEFNHLPIIALTASDGEKIKQQCMNAGMNGFITKPFKLDKIKKVLNLCIEYLNKKTDKESFALLD